MRILVLDQTHGGDKIGAEYVKLGHEVTLVDIYRTMKEKDLDLARSQGMIPVQDAPAESFDLVVVPLLCPARFLGPAKYYRIISHHQAVGKLAHFDCPVIEVTGAAAKTSTSFLLAHMMSRLGKKVLLHSSRGDFEYGEDVKVLKDSTSISPATILDLARLKGYDVAIMEVSLGVTGVGQVNVITTLGDDYPIASDAKQHPEEKGQSIYLANERLVISNAERTLWSPHLDPSVRTTTFGPDGDVDLAFDDRLQLGVPLRAHFMFKGIKIDVDFSSTFLAPAYSTAFQAAAAVCQAFDIDAESAVRSLEGFSGVPGRGEVEREGDWYMVRERNPDVGDWSIGWNLDLLQDKYGVKDIGLVIDPMNRKICEKLNMAAILEVVESHPSVKKVYLFDREPSDAEVWTDLQHIKNVYDVWAKHKVLLWCTKDGL